MRFAEILCGVGSGRTGRQCSGSAHGRPRRPPDATNPALSLPAEARVYFECGRAPGAASAAVAMETKVYTAGTPARTLECTLECTRAWTRAWTPG